jgi:hypothetical protein
LLEEPDTLRAAVMQQLRAHGLPGRAIVTAVHESAAGVRLCLQVIVGERAPYVAAVDAPARVRPGTVVPVRVDPADERSLIVG